MKPCFGISVIGIGVALFGGFGLAPLPALAQSRAESVFDGRASSSRIPAFRGPAAITPITFLWILMSRTRADRLPAWRLRDR